MRKFSHEQRTIVKNIIASLSIKRIPETQIVKEIERQTGKTVTTRFLYYVKNQIKKESYNWYSQLRNGEYEYLHEYKERINEIMTLQKKCHQIVDDNDNNPSIQLDAIAELHKLTITLSNMYDVLPVIVNYNVTGNSIPAHSKTATENIREQDIIV